MTAGCLAAEVPRPPLHAVTLHAHPVQQAPFGTITVP